MIIMTLTAVLELKQSGELYVCHGGAMMVTCRTSADILRWNVTLPLSQRTFVRRLTYIGTIQMEAPIITAMTTLNISRSLNNSSPLPLVSIISTDNTTADLNGTVITCTAQSRVELLTTDSVEITVIHMNSGNIDNS